MATDRPQLSQSPLNVGYINGFFRVSPPQGSELDALVHQGREMYENDLDFRRLVDNYCILFERHNQRWHFFGNMGSDFPYPDLSRSQFYANLVLAYKRSGWYRTQSQEGPVIYLSYSVPLNNIADICHTTTS